MKRRTQVLSLAATAEAGGPAASVRKPLYQRVVNVIRDDILKGRFPVGSLLPTEEELSERFGVSRHTVREALRHLRNDGLVNSRQGAGTTVARPGGNVYVQEIKAISDLIRYAETIQYHVDSSEIVASDAALAREIGGSEGQKWLRVEGLRYRENDKEPVCRTVVYVNADYAGVGRLIARQKGAIYEMIEDLYGEVISEVEQLVTAYKAPKETITELKLDADAVVVEVKRIYRTSSQKIAEVAINQYPAHRFSLGMTLRRTQQ